MRLFHIENTSIHPENAINLIQFAPVIAFNAALQERIIYFSRYIPIRIIDVDTGGHARSFTLQRESDTKAPDNNRRSTARAVHVFQFQIRAFQSFPYISPSTKLLSRSVKDSGLREI